MKVLFAVNDEKVSAQIVKKYQKIYKEIISFKNVYYYDAIIKELQKDKTYDRIVIGEDLDQGPSASYEQKDRFIFDKLDSISDEASGVKGREIPIILICSERRTKSESILVKLFGIGVYNAIIGEDRSVEEVCRLINKPRSKKEAKLYYKIDVDNVKYRPENENDVDEEEIQNILTHFKRLGKKEEKYAESFKNVAEQYNQEQLKVIISVLPLNVKAVLEETSPEYQKIMATSGRDPQEATKKLKEKNKTVKKRGTSEKLLQTDEKKNKVTKPVVVPKSMEKTTVKKISKKKPVEKEVLKVEPVEEEPIKEIVEEKPKRRGRPKKVKEEELPTIDSILEEKPVKRKGRPKKIQEVVEEEEEEPAILPGFADEEDDEEETTLPGFDDYDDDEDEEETTLPGFDDYDDDEDEEETTLPGFDDYDDDEEDEEETTLPGFDDYDDEDDDETTLPGFDDDEDDEDESYTRNYTNRKEDEIRSRNRRIEEYKAPEDFRDGDFARLLTSDKKIVTFLGTSKNGTSFIVNNLAQCLSEKGISTAILDLTQNKNAYYVYTNNEEELRQIASKSFEELINGENIGVQVNPNLTVYTEVPGQETRMYESYKILETLVENYSVVLIDCDFSTPKEYFEKAQEIYLVQTMDVLTIQPLTAFLRELKVSNSLDESKIKIVINKYISLRGINSKHIIGGMSSYNDPEMSFMKELFNRDTVPYIEIPFEIATYARYLEGLINCDISLKGYSKEFMKKINELANMVYPLLPARNRKPEKKPKNKQQYNNQFSSSMNNTLNNMKKNY